MVDEQPHLRPPRRKGQKRKLDEEDSPSSSAAAELTSDLAVEMEVEDEEEADDDEDEEMEGQDREICSGRSHQAIWRDVRAQVEILDRSFSWRVVDRAAAKTATHLLAEMAKNGTALII